MIDVAEALADVDAYPLSRRRTPVYRDGVALAEEVRRQLAEVDNLKADAAKDAGYIQSLQRGIDELCSAIGVERGTDEWPDFIARVRAEIERLRADTGNGQQGSESMFEIHVHHHHHFDPISIRLEDTSMAGRLDNIQAMLDRLPATIGDKIMTLRDDVRAEFDQMEVKVTRMSGAVDSTVTLLTDLRAMQQNAIEQGDLDRLRAIDEQFGGTIDRLAAAVAAPGDPGTGAEQPA